MINDSTKTVRDFVVENPATTRIFEKLKIDYCCGGHKSLEEACANAGVESETVTRLIAEAQTNGANAQETNFNEMSLSALIDYILRKHHVFVRDECERLTALLEKVCNAHGENHPEVIKIKDVFATLSDDLTQHMMKEERILFPYINFMESSLANNQGLPFAPFGTTRNPIAMMSREHDIAGELLREMRTLSNDYAVPGDVCMSYTMLYTALEEFEKDLHQHIHLENNILFPRAIEMESEATEQVM